MKLEQAEQILREAKNDRRLKAELLGGSKAKGYQVRVTLRNMRIVMLRDAGEWQDMLMAWRGL